MMSTASSNAPPSGRGVLTNSPQQGGGGGGIGTLGIDRAINNRLKVPATKKKDPIISLLARSSPLLLLRLTFINLNLKSVSANRVLTCTARACFVFEVLFSISLIRPLGYKLSKNPLYKPWIYKRQFTVCVCL